MKNPWNVLNWFYNKSPYSDGQFRTYPVGKIIEPGQLKGIL